MPYFITDSAEGCSGWGVIKDDGELMGCHTTKQAAIDQMVAISIAEGMPPGGERVANAAVAVITDIDDTIIRNGTRPIRDVIEHINSLPGDLFVVTGREERQRATTVTTLTNAGLRAFHLLMRPAFSVDPISFKIGEAERIAQTYRITHVFENDPDTRDAYAEMGLTVLNPMDFEVTEDRELPDNYRPALSDDVPEGRACGNCFFYDDDNVQGDMAFCRRWEEYVRGDYYCNAWQSDNDADDFDDLDDDFDNDFDDIRAENIPQYIRDAAQRGLELRREGFGGDGLTDQTIREARGMARGEMSDDKVVRALAWFARHEVDLEAPQNRDPEHPDWPGNGAVAFYLWGINPLDPGPAVRWLEREVERIRDERKEMQNVEVRTIDAEIRQVDESADGMTFGGYAWRYNEPSLPLPFTERIAPGAFTRTLKSRNDVRAYYNHNDELLLGSSRAKTLRIEDRADGGYVEISLPETELGRSVAYHIRRGDITGMSFGFSTVRDEWSGDGNERTLKEVRLHEVSVVSGVPAYPTTTASVRNLKVIAHRTEMDADELADAMNALQSGELDDNQANILRTVVDRMTGKTAEPEPTVPLSILQKQMELLSKAF